jgi:protein-tyrosine phosphatase
VSIDRDLDWDGCFNVRDLGGLRISDGSVTRWGAIVRADSLDRLTPVYTNCCRLAKGTRGL